jgi:hypothetical protein
MCTVKKEEYIPAGTKKFLGRKEECVFRLWHNCVAQ